MLEDERLILKIEDDLYDWKTGAAKLLSLLVYWRPLDSKDSFENTPELDNEPKEATEKLEVQTDFEIHGLEED